MPRRQILDGKTCFTTHVVTNHAPVFSYPAYSLVLCRSLNYISKGSGISIFGYVIMPDHLHLLTSVPDPPTLRRALASFRRYTGTQLIDMLHKDRCTWALDMIREEPGDFSLWQPDYYPVDATEGRVFDQKLNYIHMNPVRTGYVREPHHWRFSSAGDYFAKEPGDVTITKYWQVPAGGGSGGLEEAGKRGDGSPDLSVPQRSAGPEGLNVTLSLSGSIKIDPY